MVVFTSEYVNNRSKNITSDYEIQIIMIKELVHQENITVSDLDSLNSKASKYRKQKFT